MTGVADLAWKEAAMQREPVSSSVVESIGYNPTTAVLEIKLVAGAIYEYFMVPPSVHAELMKAASKGHFYGEFVRTRFNYRKL